MIKSDFERQRESRDLEKRDFEKDKTLGSGVGRTT
jgi:hypothetical protein